MEWLRAGPASRGWPSRRGWLAAAVVVVVAGLIVLATRVPKTLPSSEESPPPTPVSSSLVTSSAIETLPVVTAGEGPLLGVRDDWELVGFGPAGLIRIQLASGRIVHTPVPALQSSGPLWLVSGAGFTVVRPLDFVPGYLIPDGQPAQELAGALAEGSWAFPGPVADQLWVSSREDGRTVAVLSDWHGRPIGNPVKLPRGAGLFTTKSDAAGGLVMSGTGGVYQASLSGYRRITTGALAAVGPKSWLTVECDQRARCTLVVIDRGTGERRTLPVAATDTNLPRGLISPDGTAAATIGHGADGSPAVYLLDLTSGKERRLHVPIYVAGDQSMVWSPDSKWLFIVGTDQALYAVNPETARSQSIGVALPSISLLTVRAGPGQ